jgi:RNA-directed DNA polymerase
MATIPTLLAAETGMFESTVTRIMRDAPVRYKLYHIPKRNGGERLIAQPSREVKALQRALVDVLLRGLPVHQCATAYREGLSIADNARRHSGNGPILKMDFADFFPSIRSVDWKNYCERTGCLTDEEDVALTSSLLFRRAKGHRELRLAIGAPSSPILSNVLMYEFDEFVQQTLQKDQVEYTRYADDLTFSGSKTGFLTVVPPTIALAMREFRSPRVTLNAAKTVYATRKYKRFVTGLILANDGSVTIGRSRKRLLHASVHRAKVGKLGLMELAQLSGYLAFVNAVEPGFLGTLRQKYGSEIMDRLRKDVPRELVASATAARAPRAPNV